MDSSAMISPVKSTGGGLPRKHRWTTYNKGPTIGYPWGYSFLFLGGGGNQQMRRK